MQARPTSLLSRVLAGCILLMLAPFTILLYLVVKLDSRGPFIFTQKRMGFGGQPFTIYKMRTMVTGSEKATALGTTTDGNYVTRIGKFLRNSLIDELPQLLNIVKGQMAFVGPRPIPIALYEELVSKIPNFENRNCVPPGLTNISQVSLADNKLGGELVDDWNVRFEGELHYIRNKNAWYDVVILIMTGLFIVRRLLVGKKKNTGSKPVLAGQE